MEKKTESIFVLPLTGWGSDASFFVSQSLSIVCSNDANHQATSDTRVTATVEYH